MIHDGLIVFFFFRLFLSFFDDDALASNTLLCTENKNQSQ